MAYYSYYYYLLLLITTVYEYVCKLFTKMETALPVGTRVLVPGKCQYYIRWDSYKITRTIY